MPEFSVNRDTVRTRTILGETNPAMARVERGERNLSLVNIEKIALGFRITLTELFRGV